MYDNEDELSNTIPRTLRIAIINSVNPTTDLSQKILEKIGYEFKNRLKFQLLTNIKDLYKQKDLLSQEKISKGLIDTKWFEEITSSRPCLIILYYHIDEKANVAQEHEKIYNLLQEIKKNDNNISIFLFIIFKDNEENPYPFYSEDKTQKYNLRNIINKEFIFVFPDEKIWKYFEFPNFCLNVIFFARQYYLKLKVKIKEKKVKANRIEEKIECDIMIGVLSTIKSKKIEPQESKYFEEAYNLLCDKNFDIKNYYYGNKSPPNSKLNFCEVRSVADWLFFKTFKLTKRNTKTNQSNQRKAIKAQSVMTKISGSESEHRIDRFFAHIKRFISNKYFETKKEDCFAFVEYYWLFQRYDKLGKYIKENIKELSTNKDKVLLLGIVHLEKIYNLIKMIKYYRKYLINKDMNIVKHKDKDIQINMVINKKSTYYGKVPTYIVKDAKNPLFKEEMPFNEDAFIKKFIYDKKLTLDNMVKDLNNKHIPETLDFYQKFNPKDLRNEKNEIINQVYGINLYLNILINLSCIENNSDNTNIFNMPTITKNIEQINGIIHQFEYMKKFPKLYINFLNKFNDSLLYHMNTGKKFDDYQKTKLFINLSILAYLRKLKEKEEELFFSLLNDEQFTPSDKNNEKEVYINLDYDTKNANLSENNSSLMFNYSIKDTNDDTHEKKILDLAEYEFVLKTNLSKEPLKFNSLKVVFKSVNNTLIKKNNELVNSKKIELIEKEFDKEELDSYTLDNSTPVNFHCKLFMKNKMNKLQVHKIIFSFCKKENIFYQIKIKNDISKIIFMNNLNKNILNVKYPLKKYLAGTNQLFKFDFEVNKEILDDIKISDFKMNFEAQPSFYEKEVKTNATQAPKNIPNLANNLLTPNILSFENNPLNRDRSNTNLHQMQNLTAFGQQLLGQQFTNNLNNMNLLNNMNNMNNLININNANNKNNVNNLSNSLNNMKNANNLNNNLNNLNLSYLLPNNFNSGLIPNVANNINNNLNLPAASTRTSSFTFSDYNPILFANAFGVNPNLNTPGAQPVPQTEKVKEELPPPHFYVYNEENKTIDETEKSLEKSFKDFESLLENKKNKFSILMKFSHEGTYEIKFIITYSLKRKDIDDVYELSQKNILIFEVVPPFHCTHEINSSNFLSITQENADKKHKKITKFLTNQNIKINFIMKNKLYENINIKDIEIELDKDKLKDENKNIKVTSNLFEVMNLPELAQDIKDDILTILGTGEYCIPFETKFYNEFKGKIGKVKIKWTTPSLKEFEKDIGEYSKNIPLINENIFDFPHMIINSLELDYIYETKVINKKEILLNIKVENDTKKCKKIIFFIETGNEINFIISGKIKQSKVIKSKESINFIYKLIPLQSGELKLPSLKIWEININNLQDRLYSNYYFHPKIKVL